MRCTSSEAAGLRAEGIRKRYGRREVLRSVSFEAAEGICLGILGGNGSGKSTLLRTLAGVTPAEGGSFLWQGTDLLRDAAARRAALAYVPQGTPLIPELSVRDNLRLWYTGEAMTASLEAGMLGALGLGACLSTPAGQLSGGMRKRLAIGCAVSNAPRVLLLDEPTAALDLPCRELLLRCFAAFRAGGGVLLLATHDLREIAFCDRWVLLRGGEALPYAYDGDVARLTQALEAP